jgi:Leucine-rich repeat (LRR) protein
MGICILLFLFAAVITCNGQVEVCTDIEKAFTEASETIEAPVCRCLPKELGANHDIHTTDDPSENIWIGCTRQNMPSVFRALYSLNETLISHLWIWNSLINILPNDMFAKVRPRILTIESSGVSVFRKGAFSNIGPRLRSLHLKNNILKGIENRTFADLRGLRVLDLSFNKISELRRGHFDELRQLESLMIASNQIGFIEEGSFEQLANLKTLNLANNKLTNITKDTLRGLNNLEVLNIANNGIKHVDWNAFAHMKNLRTLDFGTNGLTSIELRGLGNLQKLYLNNNSIQNLQKVSLRDLPRLEVLNFDRNSITAISALDFKSLGQGGRLTSLSMVGNGLSTIEADAFQYLGELTVLSLQDNQITALSSPSAGNTGRVSILKPLNKLRRLFLSRNKITAVEDGDVNVARNLQELALDHNEIGIIHNNALSGLQLKKFFINDNKLYYLPDGIFDGWNIEQITAVDISDNPWECICGREWIGKWLLSLEDRNVPSGNLGCLTLSCVDPVEEETGDQRTWITIVAAILAFVVMLLLIAIGYLYMQENCYSPPMPLKRIPSDMMKLIPSTESLSYPNPVSPIIVKNHLMAKPQQTALKSVDASLAARNEPTMNEDSTGAKNEKRVRFSGLV